MSTIALEGLLSYLYGTLSPSNMKWVGEHLIEYAKREQDDQLRPYTIQEIDDMLDEAEAAFEAGDYLTNEEVFHHKATVAV
ncbi:MAG: hypothetical protein IJ614_08430 [Prevotella sp.]|nr:hypothetical protein [Prevotella sp.]